MTHWSWGYNNKVDHLLHQGLQPNPWEETVIWVDQVLPSKNCHLDEHQTRQKVHKLHDSYDVKLKHGGKGSLLQETMYKAGQ